MQPHSVSLICLNVFCAVKKYKQDMNHRMNHVILLNVTLNTRDQVLQYYIRINILKDKYWTNFYVLSVCICLPPLLIQTETWETT